MARRRLAAGVALLGDAAGEQRRVVGLGDDDADLGIGRLQPARGAEQRAAGAEARDEGMDPLALEVGQDLARRRAGVHLGVGLVVELPAEEPAVLLGQLDRLVEHAAALLAGRREHHPGAEKAQELPPLDAEALGHGQHQRVALLRADHRQADAGVAAGRLDHRLPRAEQAAALRILDDRQRHPVLDRAERVEGFELDVHLDAGRRQPVEAHQRGVADGLQDVVVT